MGLDAIKGFKFSVVRCDGDGHAFRVAEARPQFQMGHQDCDLQFFKHALLAVLRYDLPHLDTAVFSGFMAAPVSHRPADGVDPSMKRANISMP